MDPAHRDLLRKHRLELSDQLLVSETIVPFLYQEDILTDGQVEDIQARASERLRTLRLLELLPGRGPRAFPAFLRALDDFSWVRERLELELRKQPEAGSRDPPLPDSVLQAVPSDRVLSRLSSRLGLDWEAVLLGLGLSAQDVFRCRADHVLSVQQAALQGLVLWRRSEGRKATVEELLKNLEENGVHRSVLEESLENQLK
ncbi:LOW QUALITY PROTEIN: death domain-containing protein CRADD [Acanthochromis polyacanthus]|uniref:LOW QUALITY PROTEIN: death domain-containing protein CRADD n=1 Tax=Acanthochromis polyacanthus TaxID=80966 RepID=UPI002233F9BC|nr:LOW QUALITY PROTEIN: death domain-containing protein CRADD [Acanthochromis polyacanthus]